MSCRIASRMRDLYYEKNIRVGFSGWQSVYRSQKGWLWGDAKYSNFATQVGWGGKAKTAVFQMKPPLETNPDFAKEVREKQMRAPEMGDVMLSKAMNPNPNLSLGSYKVPDFHVKLLESAIEARDENATHNLWSMLKKYEGVPDLGMESIEISVDLVHFLLVRVQAPDLACTLIDQYKPLPTNDPFYGWPHWAWAIRRARCGETPARPDKRCELSPLVAAIMDAILLVPRHNTAVGFSPLAKTVFEADVNCYEGVRKHTWGKYQDAEGHCPLANTWWCRILGELYTALAEKPRRVHRFREDSSLRCMSFSLLDRAVLCSEVSAAPVKALLDACCFSNRELADAIALATFPGNVRGPNRAEIVHHIYACLWQRVGDYHPDTDAGHKECERWVKEVHAAWNAVLSNAYGYWDCELATTQAGTVLIPTIALDCQRKRARADPSLQQICPEDDTAIVDALLHAHDSVVYTSEDAQYARVLAHAVGVLQKEPTKTHLLQKVFQKVHEKKFDPFLHNDKNYIANFFLDLFKNHNGEIIWPTVAPCLLDKTGTFSDKFLDAAIHGFCDLYGIGNRVGARAILNGFGALPKELRVLGLLKDYMLTMCKVPPDYYSNVVGQEATLFHTRMMQADLRQLLEGGCGGAFTKDQLRDAMYFAGQNSLNAAVEVLASPPYSADMHEEDAFTHSILTELLAPGAPATRETRKHFEGTAKRQCRLSD